MTTCSINLFLFMLLFLSVSSFSYAKKQPLMMPSEAQTLFKIMDSMSNDKNWNFLYPNPCKQPTWQGIECKLGSDNYLHVTRLDFGNHPNPSCKSTSMFPYEIFQLSNLESIFFFNCFTHSKTTLSVSPTRLLNSSLQQLSLRANPSLVGSIPPQISSLKSLKILTLSQNSLVGKIPVGIFSLSSLVHLDLSYNMLTGSIPFQLGNLKNLVGLDLSYNSLVGMIPTTIGEMGGLQKLDLSSNSLVGTIPDSLEKLSSLMFMALSNNKLGGNFPRGISKLQSLQYFLMDDNPMKIPLPLEFGNLSKLQELRLANSGYFGSIPSNYALLRNLTTLSLQNNRLSGQIPTGFSDLSHIYHLNLSRNLLVGVVPFNASFLKRLGRNLDLSGNPDLCLSPTEANYSVKLGIGVNICGKNKIKAIKSSSQASQLSLKLFFMFSFLSIILY
ncbi:hypothetical protein ACFE04_001609 [Oxalis oulophora]